jgi:hypothetical protein
MNTDLDVQKRLENLAYPNEVERKWDKKGRFNYFTFCLIVSMLCMVPFLFAYQVIFRKIDWLTLKEITSISLLLSFVSASLGTSYLKYQYNHRRSKFDTLSLTDVEALEKTVEGTQLDHKLMWGCIALMMVNVVLWFIENDDLPTPVWAKILTVLAFLFNMLHLGSVLYRWNKIRLKIA